jgi:hypothetical protein
LNSEGAKSVSATEREGFIGWCKPAYGPHTTWRAIVGALDEDLTWDLLRDFAPPGMHVTVTPAHTEPACWLHEGRGHLD